MKTLFVFRPVARYKRGMRRKKKKKMSKAEKSYRENLNSKTSILKDSIEREGDRQTDRQTDRHRRPILWIVDFLVSRSQTVRHQAALSSSRSIFIGSPQGTVLSPIFFTLYTNVCTDTDTTIIIKYSDESAMEDLSNSDSVYFAEVERFDNWCRDNSLECKENKGNAD